MCACVRYLGGQQRVGVKALHAADQLVLRVHHVVHKTPVDQEPVGASVHCNALWDLTVPEAPHVRVTLVEEAVQTLLSDEAEETRDVRCQTENSGAHVSAATSTDTVIIF